MSKKISKKGFSDRELLVDISDELPLLATLIEELGLKVDRLSEKFDNFMMEQKSNKKPFA